MLYECSDLYDKEVIVYVMEVLGLMWLGEL